VDIPDESLMKENVQMTKKPRRLFTDEQKAEAVNIVKQSGKPVSQVANLTRSGYYAWRERQGSHRAKWSTSSFLLTGIVPMQFKRLVLLFGSLLMASSSPFVAHNQRAAAIAQTPTTETTVALCETPSQSVRIYQTDGETLMRAYDRQDEVVWMNRTPVSTETVALGTQYTNQLGEQTVTTVISSGDNSCTVQVGSNAPEAGMLSQGENATSESEQLLSQARQLYPDAVADLEAQCASPSTLTVRQFQNSRQSPRASFVCYSPPDTDGGRTGQALGSLPLTEDDPTFIEPFSCTPGNTACEAQLEDLQTHYPDTLQAAEFACSIKNGTLFTVPAGDMIDLRCGYNASTLFDADGDDIPDNERFTSVDISVGQVPM
jgi:hypothetical protein